jgi:hypothetical protein
VTRLRGSLRRPGAVAVWLGACFVAACGGAPPSPPVPPPQPGPTPIATPANPPRTAPDLAASPLAPVLTRLPNDVTLRVSSAPRGAEALLQLGLLAGADAMAPGLAELAAELLVASADASQGRISLRQGIARLGGLVQVEVGSQSTWITLRVPGHTWQRALAALADALAAPLLSRNQIERLRDDLVLARCQAIWNRPAVEAARTFLLGDSGTAQGLANLLDRDPSEVSLFQARLYRPEFTVLALHVPGNPAQVVDSVTIGGSSAIARWKPPVTGTGAIPMQKRRLQSGIHWAPSGPSPVCRVALLLPLPEAVRPDAPELLVMHCCVTLDGLGGRLEQLQRERGLGHVQWQGQVVAAADLSALVLSAEVAPGEVGALWQAVGDARRSLTAVPPTPSELELARRRARLELRLPSADPASHLRHQVTLALRRADPGAADRRLAELAQPGSFDAMRAASEYAAMPAAMVVFGSEVPAGLADVSRFELLPPGAYARLAGPAQVQAIAAAPWLDPALEAVGGKALLRRFAGFTAASALQTEQAPPLTETVTWSTNGTLQRQRSVLGSRIETAVANGTGTEQIGTTRLTLAPREVGLLLRDAQRHPIALLAAHARGELQFRPVAQRRIGDRELMVLEAIDDSRDRLRIHLDTTSHLIRIVEVWETMADGTVVHLADAWSDYRNAGGLRAPFRRVTEQDDGLNRVETTHSAWQPMLATQ